MLALNGVIQKIHFFGVKLRYIVIDVMTFYK